MHVITGAPLPTHHSSREYTGISVKNEAPSSTRSCHRALFQPPDSYSPPHAANRRLNATPGRGAAQRLKCTYTNLSGMTGPRARMLKGRQHPDNTEPARWAAEGIFLLRRTQRVLPRALYVWSSVIAVRRGFAHKFSPALLGMCSLSFQTKGLQMLSRTLKLLKKRQLAFSQSHHLLLGGPHNAWSTSNWSQRCSLQK